jgi:hypothetical protein
MQVRAADVAKDGSRLAPGEKEKAAAASTRQQQGLAMARLS